MYSFKNYMSEESKAYEAAWDKHRSEIDALHKSGHEKVSSDHNKTTGISKFGFESGPKEDGDKTHRGRIYFHHNNYTRKNENVRSSFGYVKHEATPHSTSRIETHTAEHKSVHAAIKHLKALYKAHKK